MNRATPKTPMEIYLASQKSAPAPVKGPVSAPLKGAFPAVTPVPPTSAKPAPVPDYKAEYDSLLGKQAETNAALKAMQARHADEIKDLAKQHADQTAALKRLETIHAQQLTLAAGTFRCNW